MTTQSSQGQRQISFARAGSVGSILALVVGAMTISTAWAEHAGPVASVVVDEGLLAYAPTQQVSGSLKVQGSDTMTVVMNRLASEFQRRHPKVTPSVLGGGSNKALHQFLDAPMKRSGKIDLKEERPTHPQLVASSRALTDAEFKQFVANHGYEPVGLPVAVDAVAMYVHASNPIQGLTLEQVDAMFSTNHQRGLQQSVTQWGQLGLGQGWEGSPIHLYGRDRRSGTRGFFQEHVLVGGDFAPGIQEEPGAASVILDLIRDPLGIGYSGLGMETGSTRIVPLAEKAGLPFITPTAATIADQSYPLRRVLYVYIDKAPNAPLAPIVQEFVSFITSREGQEAVVKAGFFPLPIDQVKKGMFALDRHTGNGALVN